MNKEVRKSDKAELKTMADALVTTLGNMPPQEADRIVKEVAETIYRDILGLKGRVVKTEHIYACDARNFSANSTMEGSANGPIKRQVSRLPPR